MSTSIARTIAFKIGAAVRWLLPAYRHDWRQAMLSDLHYIESDSAALRWACGCFLVAMIERVKSMIELKRPGSRAALLAELFLCFFPLTVAWGLCIADLSRGWPASMLLGIGAIFGTAGPLGLVVAVRYTLSSQRVPNGLSLWMLVSSIALVPLSIVAFASDGTLMQVLRDTVLIGVLPAIGSAHLLALNGPSPTAPGALHA